MNACTFTIDQTIREYAEIVQDRSLLGKLSEGDMHALDAKYHSSCKLTLYNKSKKALAERGINDAHEQNELTVLSQLLSFIEEERESKSMSLFKMSELCKVYDSQFRELHCSYNKKVHTTRLKERLLHMVPNLQAQRQGKETVLIFDTDVSSLLNFARTLDDDAFHLARAAQIVRKDILSKDYCFDGTVKASADVVPESLRALTGMIMHGNVSGSTLTEISNKQKSVSSVSEVLMFNTRKGDKRSKRPTSSR